MYYNAKICFGDKKRKGDLMKERRLELGGIAYSYLLNKKTGEKRVRQHCHEKYEIIYVPNGKGSCIIEGVSYEIHPETLLVLPPFTYHYIEILADSDFERYLLQFRKEDVSSEIMDIFSSFDVDNTDAGYFCAHNVNGEALKKAFSRFTEEPELPSYEKELYFRLVLSELLIYVLAQKQRGAYERNESELGARVIRYLGECITKNTSLEHLEKYFFVSKHHLCRAFKKHNGISIHGYITYKRLMYAKNLIDNGETAYVAADKVGYSDYSSFYRAYLKLVGKSPTSKKREVNL